MTTRFPIFYVNVIEIELYILKYIQFVYTFIHVIIKKCKRKKEEKMQKSLTLYIFVFQEFCSYDKNNFQFLQN